MDTQHLKLFRDIAASGSMSRGAAQNGISQSAASQHVQELERGLEVSLIDRSSRPLRLTDAGKLYADLCRDVLKRHEEFDEALGRLKTSVVGSARVAAIFSVGLVEMSQLEEEFSRRWPEAKLDVQYLRPERVYEAVRGDQADLGLVSYPQPARDLTVIPWRQEEMGVAAAPSHPIAGREVVRPADLEGLPFVGFDPDLPIRRDVDRFLREHGVGVKVTMEFDSIPMIKEALGVGDGVSILPVRMLRAEILAGSLVCRPLAEPGLVRPLGIIHQRRKLLNRPVQLLLALLQERPVA